MNPLLIMHFKTLFVFNFPDISVFFCRMQQWHYYLGIFIFTNLSTLDASNAINASSFKAFETIIRARPYAPEVIHINIHFRAI